MAKKNSIYVREAVNEFRFIGKPDGTPRRVKMARALAAKFRLKNKTGSIEMYAFGEMAKIAMTIVSNEAIIAVLGMIVEYKADEKSEPKTIPVAIRLNLLEKPYLLPQAKLIDLSFLYDPRRIIRKGEEDDGIQIQGREDTPIEEPEDD